MRIQILVERLRIGGVPEERIQPVECSGGGVVVSGSEVLLADAGVELFSAVEVLRGGGGHGEVQGVAVGVVVVDLQQASERDNRSGKVGENPRVAVAVEVEDLRGFTRRAYTLRSPGGLTDVVVTDGVDDLLDQVAGAVGDGFLKD